MKVVHLCYSFSPLSETFIYDIITTQIGLGVDSHVISLRRENTQERPFEEDLIQLLSLPVWDMRRYWNRFIARVSSQNTKTANWDIYRQLLIEKLQVLKPDVIHAHFGPMGVLATEPAKKLDIPLVTSCYGYDMSQLLQDRYWVGQYQKYLPESTALVGISNHICGRISRFINDEAKVHCAHLGIDIEQFTFMVNRPAEDEAVKLLFVGRFVEKKSPLELLKAFRIALKSTNKSMELQMVGEGPLLSEASEFVNEKGMHKHVRLMGRMSHNKVREIFQKAHIYVQHSVTASNGDEEGQGVTFAEASASGLPVVATRHNGIPDVVIDGETGFLVEEHDTEAMGKKMAELVENPEQWSELAEAGRRHIEKEFNKEKQVEKLINVYQNITSS